MDQPLTNHEDLKLPASHWWDALSLSRRGVLALFAGATLYTVALVSFVVYTTAGVTNVRAGSPVELDQRMRDCVSHTLEVTGMSHPELFLYRGIRMFCNHELYSVDSLVDFDIRREKLLRQELDERVLLLMVVTVTLSGVAFAGMQIWLSYTLARTGIGKFGDDTNLSLRKDELALKSSVTGLFILAFSLAFFGVYVKWIYPNQEVTIARPEMPPVEQGVVLHVPGTLVPPAGKLPNQGDLPAAGGGTAPNATATQPDAGPGKQ